MLKHSGDLVLSQQFSTALHVWWKHFTSHGPNWKCWFRDRNTTIINRRRNQSFAHPWNSYAVWVIPKNFRYFLTSYRHYKRLNTGHSGTAAFEVSTACRNLPAVSVLILNRVNSVSQFFRRQNLRLQAAVYDFYFEGQRRPGCWARSWILRLRAPFLTLFFRPTRSACCGCHATTSGFQAGIAGSVSCNGVNKPI